MTRQASKSNSSFWAPRSPLPSAEEAFFNAPLHPRDQANADRLFGGAKPKGNHNHSKGSAVMSGKWPKDKPNPAKVKHHPDLVPIQGGYVFQPQAADPKSLVPDFIPDASTAILIDMMTYKRTASGVAEEAFIDKFIEPFSPHRDMYGNYWVQVGDNPNVLWSSHTDTVHHTDGRQEVYIAGDYLHPEIIGADGKKNTNCLGADDAAGIWLLTEMITAGVPGLYVFHRDEESGGQGSSWIARNTPEVFDGITFAIAFDRKGYDSIITHQGDRCCSDAFADSLAKILGGRFKGDDSGTFTDTANYTGLIGECSNVSVGYFGAHGPTEKLDLPFIVALRDTLISADFSTLVAERKPGEEDPDSGVGGGQWWQDYQDRKSTKSAKTWHRGAAMGNFVYDNVDLVADFLESRGFDIAELEDYADEIGMGIV
jgi:hypothetical protein